MNIVFRVDAESSIIGTGHVMRCLNLAEELSKNNKIIFITRKFDGHLGSIIKKKKYKVFYLEKKKIRNLLRKDNKIFKKEVQINEAKIILKFVKRIFNPILIVDHYFLDLSFENLIKNYFKKTIIIDDLANRKHNCDLIIDQNYYNPNHSKYKKLLVKKSKKVFGPKFALINKKYKTLRNKIKVRRKKMKKLLIFMGGSDPSKEIFKAIKGLNLAKLDKCHANIVVGKAFKFVKELKFLLKKVKFNYKIYIQTKNMHKLLFNSDLAILSGGMITWEKCVVGAASLVTIKSKNQIINSKALENKGAHIITGFSHRTTPNLYKKKIEEIKFDKINSMMEKSKVLCDGNGVKRISDLILKN